MICDHFQDLAELYALGALDGEEMRAFRDHIAGGCQVCQSELRRALRQNEMVFLTTPLVDPPARLRRRIQQTFVASTAPRRHLLPWALAAAATLVLGAGLVMEERARHAQIEVARSNFADVTRLASVVEILRAKGTKEVAFGSAKPDSPHGTLFIHQRLGIAVVVGSLPAAPAGWKYESWVVPKAGSPQPVEAFRVDEHGSAVTIIPGPIDPATVSAVAVSMEPEDARPIKPTTMVFAAPV